LTPPWLEKSIEHLNAALSASRLPHALMIHEAPGAGGEWLAHWLAAKVLGSREGVQHPDLVVIQPVEDSKQIRIEQVRELSDELSLTSHQGGYKVGILSPADTLNRFAANALLKTLEEPSARTLLVLVLTQPSRLPATILSRCQRLTIQAPSRAQSVAWLEAHHQGEAKVDWNTVLDVVGDAPLLAAKVDAGAVAQFGIEVRRALDEAVAGHLDPVATAERWSKSEPALRLACFETWVTDRIRKHGLSMEMRSGAHLSSTQEVLNIRDLFGLLDGVRGLKSTLDTPINRSLALESLLRRLQPRRASGVARPR